MSQGKAGRQPHSPSPHYYCRPLRRRWRRAEAMLACACFPYTLHGRLTAAADCCCDLAIAGRPQRRGKGRLSTLQTQQTVHTHTHTRAQMRHLRTHITIITIDRALRRDYPAAAPPPAAAAAATTLAATTRAATTLAATTLATGAARGWAQVCRPQ